MAAEVRAATRRVVMQFHTVSLDLGGPLVKQVGKTRRLTEVGMVALDVADIEWESLAASRAADIISDIYKAMRLACDGQV